MPKENRKRGKKHKKTTSEVAENEASHFNTNRDAHLPTTSQGGPSWIRPAESDAHNPEAPYGYIDNDVKAYFRTVDVQIRDWQENERDEDQADVVGDGDPNDERHLFFVAALSEMTGKERQLATDPECSVVLERMIHSMDDFVLRVFFDSLAGSFETLSTHRFASHVCQTLFTVAKDMVSRETRGILPKAQESSEHGELRTITDLVLDICKELLPSIGHLITDPFASHVVRSLLVLLSPTLSANDSNSNSSSLRSKKSQKWKAKQGVMTSMFTKDKGKGKEPSISAVPPSFGEAARRLVTSVRQELNDNEVRALAANKAASPTLKMLIEIEADHDMAAKSGSLMDSVLVGTVSSYLEDESTTSVEPSDFVVTLLRDAASSHLLETIIARCPDHIFSVLWATYFSGNLPKLAIHPVANFVVSRAVDRVSSAQLKEAFEQLSSSWNKLLQSKRIVVLKALVEQASRLKSCENIAQEAIFSIFQLRSAEERLQLVPCVLHLMTYHDCVGKSDSGDKENTSQNFRHQTDGIEQTSQGSQLLQALLHLSTPHNQPVIDSLTLLSVEERIKMAHNIYSSHVFDVLLSSPSITAKVKRTIVMDFIGSYHVLVDDRIGSHIVDRCWEYADTYLKEKIARSLIPHDKGLAASYYGRFFARNLNLQLLQRRPDEWRTMQTERRKQKEAQTKPIAATPVPAAEEGKEKDGGSPSKQAVKDAKKTKRKRQSREDEIDSLFDSTIGKKVKRAALNSEGPDKQDDGVARKEGMDVGLLRVLGAIKVAPDHEGDRKKKRRSKPRN